MSTDFDYHAPGVPVEGVDKDGPSYFFPSSKKRTAESQEQRDGLASRWMYRGHKEAIKSVCVTGEDPFGRIRVASTDGRGLHSWLELSDDDSVKNTSGEYEGIACITLVTRLDVLAASSGSKLIVFDRRTLRHLATLETSKKALLHLEYNRLRDEVISGGPDGCHAWRLAPTPHELYAPVIVPFELTLLRGFERCSHWTEKMAWDETAQVIITIDGMRVKTYDAATGINRYKINGAHESPVTAGLWFSQSENIITGCFGGLMKVWACQHTSLNGTKQSRRRKKGLRRRKYRRRKYVQSPALIASFKSHNGAVTGLVLHGMDSSWIISSSTDGTLRIWDVDRLVPIATVRIAGAVTSLLAHNAANGRLRIVCTEAKGLVRMMIVHKVCETFDVATEGVQKLHYYPPATNRIYVSPHAGILLVQLERGLWGVMSELLFLPVSERQAASDGALPTPRAPPAHQIGKVQLLPKTRKVTACDLKKGAEEEGEGALPEEEQSSSPFDAWAPLSSVTELYAYHALSRRRRKVFCLADSGTLHTFSFGPGKGEASKVESWKVDLQDNDATTTCMLLLPKTPVSIVATLDRLAAAHDPNLTGFGLARGEFSYERSDEGGQGASNGHGSGINGRGNDIYRLQGGGRADVIGERAKINYRESRKEHREGDGDQVVAVGTSRGDIFLVETVVSGMTLAHLEGIFASKVFGIAFCYASIIDATTGTKQPMGCSERLVCWGLSSNGIGSIKGIAILSLTEVFSIQLVEVPTSLEVATRRPILLIGYADGSLQMTKFGKDRVCDVESSALTDAHTGAVNTIAFNERYGCMATGSADGCIMIWNLEGQLQYTVHLQEPALGMAFAEVAGQLVISQVRGICYIPTHRWCPLQLLLAVERVERKAADGCFSEVCNTTTAGGGGVPSVRDSDGNLRDFKISGKSHISTRQGDVAGSCDTSSGWQRDKYGVCARSATGIIGEESMGEDEYDVNTEQQQLIKARCIAISSVLGVTEEEGQHPAVLAAMGPTLSAVVGVEGVPEVPAIFDPVWCSTMIGGQNDGEGWKYGLPDCNKLKKKSILDHMSAKFTSLSAPPPPRNESRMKIQSGVFPSGPSISRELDAKPQKKKSVPEQKNSGEAHAQTVGRSASAPLKPVELSSEKAEHTNNGMPTIPVDALSLKSGKTEPTHDGTGSPALEKYIVFEARTTASRTILLDPSKECGALAPGTSSQKLILPSSPDQTVLSSSPHQQKRKASPTNHRHAALGPDAANIKELVANKAISTDGRKQLIDVDYSKSCCQKTESIVFPEAAETTTAKEEQAKLKTGPSNSTGNVMRGPDKMARDDIVIRSDQGPTTFYGSYGSLKHSVNCSEYPHVLNVPVLNPRSPPQPPLRSSNIGVLAIPDMLGTNTNRKRTQTLLPGNFQLWGHPEQASLTIRSFFLSRATAGIGRRAIYSATLPNIAGRDAPTMASAKASVKASEAAMVSAAIPAVLQKLAHKKEFSYFSSPPPPASYSRACGPGSQRRGALRLGLEPSVDAAENPVVKNDEGGGCGNREMNCAVFAGGTFFPARPLCGRGYARGAARGRLASTPGAPPNRDTS